MTGGPDHPGSWTPPPPAPPPPAGPAPGLSYAGFWVRAAAFLVDGCLITIVMFVILVPFGVPLIVAREVGTTTVFELHPTSSTVNTVLSTFFFVGFWARLGQTPGMMLFNLRVLRAEDGQKIDLPIAAIRYLGLLVSLAVFLIGVIWVAFDRNKQGWHDKIVRTVVVRPS